jgi:hypothetical protein
MYRSNPHQDMPSTTVTASRVTEGMVECESMVHCGADKGLDLWEAFTFIVDNYFPGAWIGRGGPVEILRQVLILFHLFFVMPKNKSATLNQKHLNWNNKF